MTMSVKLSPPLEQRLRQCSAALGRPASELIREALQTWLDSNAELPASAFVLGQDLFGRHRGPEDLSSSRKTAVAQVWSNKQRRASRRRG